MALPYISVKILKRKSLLAIIDNSLKGGENFLFRNLYVKNGKAEEVDILENGKNSCAIYVSWILLTLELIKHPHASVDGTEKDLLEYGWYRIDKPRPGAVVVWDPLSGDNKLLGEYETDHRHMGFCVNDEEAVSNDSKGSGFPFKHSLDYYGSRPMEFLWHPELDNE